jgi:hypothetical protein
MDDDPDKPKMFRTLRGFLNGKEPNEANYFRFSATLRIHGDGVPFEEISQRLAVDPTHLHRKGEQLYGLESQEGAPRTGLNDSSFS